jgi:AraC-like DNA-binding protein
MCKEIRSRIHKTGIKMHFFQWTSTIKILKSKLFFWSTIPSFAFGILILAYFSSIKDFPVFPNSKIFSYKFYTDSAAGGNSKIINNLISDSIIKLEYIISTSTNNPYVGLNVGLKGSKSINLEPYNQLTIKLKGSEINGIGIALISLNSLNKKAKKSQEILFYHIFKITSGINTYHIGINKFGIPDWWGEFNRIEEASLIKPDLKNLESINVSSAFTPNTGIKQCLEVYSIAFSRNNKRLINLIFALEFTFILLVFSTIFAIEKIKENKKTVTITYRPVENKNIETSKSNFIDFINENFNNSQLTLKYISRETGTGQRKITIEIQNIYGCNLKTYINRLRLIESKRLLIETDLSIGEITYAVGFNNQTHFNRVFKADMQISPSVYRNLNKPIAN